MEQHPFDRLARALAQPQSRRGLLRSLGLGMAATAAGSLAPRLVRAETQADCATGLTVCNSHCVSLQTDPNNCGSCGHTVTPGNPCINGLEVKGPAAPPPSPAFTVVSASIVPQAGPSQGNASCGPTQVFNPATGACTPSNGPINTPVAPTQTVPVAPATCAHLGEDCFATFPCCSASQGLLGQNGEQICSTGGTCVCNKSAGYSGCADVAGPKCCMPGEVCCPGPGNDAGCVPASDCCNGVFCAAAFGRTCVNGQCVCANTGAAPCVLADGSSMCCTANTTCVPGHGCMCSANGAAGQYCPTANAANCCPTDQPCCGTFPGAAPFCCPSGATCEGELRCRCADGRGDCGAGPNRTCCAADQVCCLDECRPAGTTACLSIVTPENPSAVVTCCAPGTTCCPGAGQVLCCQPGTTCQGGQCVASCSATSPCSNGGCCDDTHGVCVATCPAGTCCSNGLCIPTGQCPNGGCCENGACVSRCASGCCQNGVCVPTAQQTNTACGVAGGICQSCGAGQSCATTGQFAGQCVCTGSGQPPVNGQCATCDATSCQDGCCQNGVCTHPASQSNARCGSGGATCAACPNGQNCVNGVCSGCTPPCPFGQCCAGANTCVALPSEFCSFCTAPIGGDCLPNRPPNSCTVNGILGVPDQTCAGAQCCIADCAQVPHASLNCCPCPGLSGGSYLSPTPCC